MRVTRIELWPSLDESQVEIGILKPNTRRKPRIIGPETARDHIIEREVHDSLINIISLSPYVNIPTSLRKLRHLQSM